MSVMPTKEKRSEFIKRMCAENNLTVAEVLRKANVASGTLTSWEEKDPKSFQVFDAIVEAIEVLSTEKQQAR
jgi:transcriptional regulator with XRE-family HTH domain